MNSADIIKFFDTKYWYLTNAGLQYGFCTKIALHEGGTVFAYFDGIPIPLIEVFVNKEPAFAALEKRCLEQVKNAKKLMENA